MVVGTFPTLSETFIVSKFLGLLERGWDMHVLCSTTPDEGWINFPALQQKRAVRHRVRTNLPVHPRWLVAVLMPIVLLFTVLRRPWVSARYLLRGWPLLGTSILKQFYLDVPLILLRPDIIHFEFGALAKDRTYLGKLLNCKVVVSFRGYDLNFTGLDDSEYYRTVWQEADALHCLGDDLWRRAQRRGCPADKSVALIPPAINVHMFRPEHLSFPPAGTPGRPLRLLSIGRLEWKKGYEFVLQAVKLIKEQGLGVQYRIVGAGSYLEALAFCRRQLGLEDTVEFVGKVPHHEIPALHAWADLFVHGAVSEGFCNAVLEAQATGLPVVCSDADGLSENVLDGVSGYVVPRRDPKAMAKRITQLASDSELRQQFGEAGAQRVRKSFHLEDQIRAFEQLYTRTVRGERSSAAPWRGRMDEGHEYEGGSRLDGTPGPGTAVGARHGLGD